MPFKGIIFDFNGVLLWDNRLHELAWTHMSLKLRGKRLTEEEAATRIHGRNNAATLTWLTGRELDAETLERLIDEKEALYHRLCLAQRETFRLSPGAVELLTFLTELGVPRTIATAAGSGNLDFYFKYLDLARWFDRRQIVYDNGSVPGKPAPGGYLQAAANLGLSPAACVVVEDSLSGIAAARAAGIGHIIALGPKDTHVQLRALDGVSQVVETLGEIETSRLFLP